MHPVKPLAAMIRVADTNSADEEIRLASQRVVSIEHTLWKCERCRSDCWIGPEQRLMVTVGGAEAVCYLCIVMDGDLRNSQGDIPLITLDPHADDKPRRF